MEFAEVLGVFADFLLNLFAVILGGCAEAVAAGGHQRAGRAEAGIRRVASARTALANATGQTFGRVRRALLTRETVQVVPLISLPTFCLILMQHM